MVAEEKNQNKEMMEGQETTPPAEGGDAKKPEAASVKEKEPKKSEPAPEDFDDIFDEEREYSDEEYTRFKDLYEQTLSEIDEGQIVVGRVLAITGQDVLVDIGFKSEGTIPLEEFGEPPEVKVGDKIEVFLDTIEDMDGQLVLSKKKANFMRLWDKVVDIHNQGGTIEGICTRRIKGGIVVDLMGVDAFLPGSQIDVKPIRDFDALIGKTFSFKIVKVNRLRKNIVVSRRVMLEESMKEQRSQVLEDLEKGQVYEGTVKNITDFGVFVDLGGVDGLLHINDLSWGRINHPSEVVDLDQKIEVKVLDFNDAKDRISLGLKQLQPHPWDGIDDKYPEGGMVNGKVVSIADYGAFVELEKGVEGLIHVSEMSWTRHNLHPSKVVSVGEEIEVKILNVDKERKRISLGLKQLTPDPWDGIEEKFPSGTKYKGRVRNMTNFGAFVEMEDGIDGLIHISDLSWTRKVKHPSEILKKGEEIEVVVLEINKGDRRVSLGFKQLTEDPWPAFSESYKVGTVTKAKIVRFVDKGLIVELPLGLEGFVPLTQMGESSIAKVQQNIKVDDEMEFMVIEFDKENKRVVLSRVKVLEGEKSGVKMGEQETVEAYLDKQDDSNTLGDLAGVAAADAGADKKASAEEKPKAKPKAKKADEPDDAPAKAEEEAVKKAEEDKPLEEKPEADPKAEDSADAAKKEEKPEEGEDKKDA